MAVVGETITNPQTGEQITFRRITEELLELDFTVSPGGGPAAAHVHPEQVERFAVRSGALRIAIGAAELTLGAGGRAVVPPGTPHVWHAVGDGELRLTITFEPALEAVTFFERFFALAQAGRTKADGTMRLLDAVAVLDESRGFLYLAKPPVAVQKAVVRLLAPIARLLGGGRVPGVGAARYA